MRSLWRKLPQSRWKRLFALVAVTFGGGIVLIAALAVAVFFLFQSPRFMAWFMSTSLGRPQTFPESPDSPSVPYTGPQPSAAGLASGDQLYRATNVWTVHLTFTSNQWAELGPKHVERLPDWLNGESGPKLSNPASSRNGLAGVVGLDYPWSVAQLEFGGVTFSNVGVRFKGNGTFLGATRSYKRPFKIDLHKNGHGQKLAGHPVINLGNLVADPSAVSDSMGYRFYREAGVPAPRTSYARVFLTVGGHLDHQLLGLYVMIENPDSAWVGETFASKETAVFKPVTYELFKDLGNEWKNYARIYDPKTKLTTEQERRVIEFAKFFTGASDAELAARLGDYLDLDEVARYLACEVLLANYDGILSTGQNFLLFLDGKTGKFGLGPWDLDQSWGKFTYVSTADKREHASIWHPWTARNYFLERLYAVEPFRQVYRERLQDLLERNFVPEQLNRRMDELAMVIRPALAEESGRKLRRFEEAVSAKFRDGPRDSDAWDEERRPVFQLKRFIAGRAESVRDQLAGKSEGERVKWNGH